MKMLYSPRGVIAVSEVEKDLIQIMDTWPNNERLSIGEWKPKK